MKLSRLSQFIRPGALKLSLITLAFASLGCDSSSEKDKPTDKDTGEASGTADGTDRPKHLTKLTNSLGAELVFLEGGTFQMGSPKTETKRDRDELLHQVTLSKGFYISSTELTQKQWQEIMKSEPWLEGDYPRAGDDLPASEMSMAEITAFFKKLNELEQSTGTLPEGFEYRLPTEAEWEYACRAGTQTPYFSGDTTWRLKKYARFSFTAEGQGVSAVASLRPNAWGLYDMHGNVWECCLDQVEWEVGPGAIRHLVNDVYQEGIIDPVSKKGSEFVVRGGAWIYQDYECRSANRSAWDGKESYSSQGIRPVLAPVSTE